MVDLTSPRVPQIFDEMADLYEEWAELVGDQFSYDPHPSVLGWCLDGYGDHDSISLTSHYYTHKRCVWITERSPIWMADFRHSYPFKPIEGAVNYVRRRAEETGNPIYTLAVAIHDLNEIVVKARFVRSKER